MTEITDRIERETDLIESCAKIAEETMILLSLGNPGEGPFTRQDRAVDEARAQIAAAIRARISDGR